MSSGDGPCRGHSLRCHTATGRQTPGRTKKDNTNSALPYSLNNRTEFMEYLRTTRDSVTPEHAQALRDVYGQT